MHFSFTDVANRIGPLSAARKTPFIRRFAVADGGPRLYV